MWGENPPDDEMIRTLHAAFDAGMNWVDTAELYGPHRSEELVGKAVRDRPDVMVFTKLWPYEPGSGSGPNGVRAGLEGSLRRLGRDVIDLYQLHAPPPGDELEGTWEAMARAVDDGLVRYIGVSNLAQAPIEICEKVRHVDSLQPMLSMLTAFNSELIAWCEEQGIGVIAYGPLAYGMLTGTITMETTFESGDWRSGNPAAADGSGDLAAAGTQMLYHLMFEPGAREHMIARVESLRPVAERLGISLAQLALAWVAHQPGVTGAICGTRSASRARENAAAGDVSLSPSDLEEISAILG